MIRYRRKNVAALLLVLALLTALFAGCDGSGSDAPAASPEQLISVLQRDTGETVSIGDTREEVQKITGSDINGGWDFLEDGTVGDFYWDAPGIRVDYKDDVVVRIMLIETADWSLMNGLYPGMPKAEASELYKDVPEREVGASGGILISYDENMQPIPLDEFAPYLLTISFTDDDVVELAYIQHNFE